MKENGTNILLYYTKYSADIQAAAQKESINEAEREHGAGPRSRQYQIGERKARWHGRKGR